MLYIDNQRNWLDNAIKCELWYQNVVRIRFVFKLSIISF